MQKIDFSLIIPCYNEGDTFETSVLKIIAVLQKLGISWEVIFVEDKSQDQTANYVKKMPAKIKNSKTVFHKKNVGRGGSVSDGIMNAKGDICGYLDVDLEVSPTYIPLFIEEIKNGSDMVVGKRFYDKGSIVRYISTKAYAYFVRILLNLPISDTEAGYKFFRRKSILPLLNKVEDKKWFWDTEICARANAKGLKISEIPVLFVRRPEKKSTVKLIPDSLEYLAKLVKFKLNDSK